MCWYDSYRAAILETDWTKMEERIQTAESQIHKRRLVLSQDHGGTPQESKELVNVMDCLRIMREDAVEWLEKQNGTQLNLIGQI
jgi:hypothetical protein